jgi:glutamine amidotransferase
MGWNEVHVKKNSIYFDTTIQERFYFAHSYAVTCKNKADILTTTTHGHNFTSSFLHGNVLGVQFHPEKSHSFGKKFFESFLKDIDA